MTGEELYNEIQSRVINNGGQAAPWAHLTPYWRTAFSLVAAQFTIVPAVTLSYGGFGPLLQPAPTPPANAPAAAPFDPLTALTKYGRHLPDCSLMGACTCGYASIEVLLPQLRSAQSESSSG